MSITADEMNEWSDEVGMGDAPTGLEKPRLTPNKEVITEWVEALESGDYKQTEGYLQLEPGNDTGNESGYCCLGVLCELAANHGVIDPPVIHNGRVIYDAKEDEDEVEESSMRWFGSDQMPPMEVMRWAGFTGQNPIVGATVKHWGEFDYDAPSEPSFERHELTELNDTFKLSFPEIAAAIRAQYLA